ncbi:MAG: hypothetical protein R3Y09_09030 [Clostridia bacterium]
MRNLAIKKFKTLDILWYITIISAFFGASLLPITISGLGTLYLFRIILPITFVVWIVRVVKDKEHIFYRSPIILSTYALFVCLLLGGFISLFLALDFRFTFDRLFNLSLDLLFCFLAINLLPKNFVKNIKLLSGMLIVMQILAIFETIFFGIFSSNEGSARYKLFSLKYMNVSKLSFTNQNDLASSMAFLTIILTWIILLLILHKKIDIKPKICYTYLTIINAITFYIACCNLTDLVIYTLFIHSFGLVLYFLFFNRKAIFIPICILLIFTALELSPKFKTYYVNIHNAVLIHQHNSLDSTSSSQDSSPDSSPDSSSETLTELEGLLSKPFVYGENVSLSDKFVTEDNEVNLESTGGVRLTLIKFGFKTFFNSCGLGVGLGNTETLAAQAGIIPMWGNSGQISLHCFPLRFMSDVGIFLVLPALVLVFLILRLIFETFKSCLKLKTYNKLGDLVAILFCAMSFVILSVSSSDAQDLLIMWVFIALSILLIENLKPNENE